MTPHSGEVIVDELAVADAHPLGTRPFERKVEKFTELADREPVEATVPGRRVSRERCRGWVERVGRSAGAGQSW